MLALPKCYVRFWRSPCEKKFIYWHFSSPLYLSLTLHAVGDVVTRPVTKRGHDAVLVCVDRLSKMTHMAATTTTVTAEGTARLFADHVINLHGWPTDIVSDRDSRLAGKFTRELNQLTGVHSSMSTAFHPQSDGQTERVNRVLEDMLRHYVNAAHTDWDDLLPINNAYHESIQNTPSC